MEHYRILITGSPRSGTQYISRALQYVGVLARHERIGVDGIVSCLFCVEDFHYIVKIPHPRLSECSFENIYHLVRDPRDVIPSIVMNIRDDFWHWQEKHTGIPGDLMPATERSSMFWNTWNQIIEDRFPQAKRIRLEDIHSEWKGILNSLGVEYQDPIDVHPSQTEHERLSYDQIENVSLRSSVMKRAYRYGYTED